jgi:hypothetical protein
MCKPFDEIVAVKLMDLENVNCSLVRGERERGGDEERDPTRGAPATALLFSHLLSFSRTPPPSFP